MRILVLNLNHIGDSIFVTPSLTALKAAYPDACVTQVTSAPTMPLFEHDPRLNHVVRRPQGGFRALLACFPAVRRARPFDLALNFCRNSVALSLLAGASAAATRVGFANTASARTANRLAQWTEDGHMAECLLRVAHAAGATAAPNRYSVHVTEQQMAAAAALLARAGVDPGSRPIAVAVGASTQVKKWPAERFGVLASELSRTESVPVVAVGGRGDLQLQQTAMARADGRLVPLCGLADVGTTAAILAHCRLLVANDTGPLHMGAAVGTPTLGLFGPTNPTRTGPYAPGCAAIRHNQACAACATGKRRGRHTCMQAIDVEEVVSAARELMRGESGLEAVRSAPSPRPASQPPSESASRNREARS